MEEKYIKQATIVPHWLPDGDAFWYRREIATGGSEFIFVDPVKQARKTAFDHEVLADALEQRTGKKTAPDSLPFNWIDLAPDASWVRFRCHDQVWQFSTDKVLENWEGEFDDSESRILAAEVPSVNSSQPVDVTFLNSTHKTVEMLWINHLGHPISYGTIEAKKSRNMSTFDGHVWRLVDKDTQKPWAVYTARKGDGQFAVEAPQVRRVESEKKGETLEAKTAASEKPDTPAPEEGKKPNVLVRDFNIWIGTDGVKEEGTQDQISFNGSMFNPYDKDKVFPSPDGKFAAAWQFIPKEDHKIHLIESSPDDQLQPKLHSHEYLKPGDRVRLDRPRMFDLEKKCEVPTSDELFRFPYQLEHWGWSKNGEEYRFQFNERGHKHLRVIGMNRDGTVRVLVEESSDTFIDYSQKHYHRVMNDAEELLWASERDGWNHLYLFDLEHGSLKNQVTKGEWVVRSVENVDEEKRTILFRGHGMVPEQDPYYLYLARVNFDGSGLLILSEGEGNHTWKWTPSKRHFIDTWSRIDMPPTTVLRETQSGQRVVELEHVDIAELRASGWEPAEIFVAPGRDQKTPIHGIIIRPSGFDPAKKYPVLEHIYAGPHGFSTPKSFETLKQKRRWTAEGYVVVQLDGMGTNWRSKTFHDVCYKNLKDAGFPDRIAWIKAAASTRPWMDISRVGIYGGSAGGQNAVAALLHHGDFYKAATADCGCHDNRMDKLWWNEQWMGYPVDKSYQDSSNIFHADKLKGALMLIVGELDRNVDPSSTLQLAKALIKADKDHELLFIPGGGHGCGTSPYALRRRRDFFRKHLLEC